MPRSLLDPERTLAIVFGASEWPFCKSLPPSSAFSSSARDIIKYLKSRDGLGLEKKNVLDLFDRDLSSDDIDSRISAFLVERQLQLGSTGSAPTDLLFYYVGHGGFSSNGQDYFLAIRKTREGSKAVSSVRVTDLANTLKRDGKDLRRYLILDCCFAAAAFSQFQAGSITDGIRAKTLPEFPRRGTVLFCAASKQDFAILASNDAHTMFSGALLDVLHDGDPGTSSSISFSRLSSLVEDRIAQLYPDTAVRPQVLSPDSRQGDIADLGVFPNAALKALVNRAETANLAAEDAAKSEQLQQNFAAVSRRQYIRFGFGFAILLSIVTIALLAWLRPNLLKLNAPPKDTIVLRGVHFDFNKARIRPGDAASLDEAANQLKTHPTLKVKVVSYCDPDDPSNRDTSSDGPAPPGVATWEICGKLAGRRADAVVDYLVKAGISKERLIPQTIVGNGGEVANGDTSEGRAQNRRVELVPAN